MGNHRAVPDGRHGIADSGLQSHTDVGHRKGTQKMGIHRMPRKPSVMTRTVAAGGVAAGGAACCLGLLGDGTLPTANAFSASFVEPNGTTVQLNILQGNVINPQFNPGGNSSNTSTIGNLFAGQGNGNTTNVGVTSTGSGSGTTNVAVSNGNVVQINILSGNVFNPQLSLFGGNSSTTSTIGNAAIGNGNGNPTNVGVVSTGSGSQTTNTTVSNGNSTQIDILSGNVFNPQLSLFGGNSSTTSTIGNAAIGNGNGNPTNVGVTSTGSGSQTTNTTVSNGNSTQTAFGSGNVFNPQLSLFGGNSSNTSTLGNAAIGNGNGNFTGVGVTSTGTGTGSGVTVGVTNTEGNSNQKTNLSGNIINPQLSSGLGSGTPLSTAFSVGSRTPLSTPVSSAAGANGTPSKRHVSFGRS
jgi:hypothetical protein